MDKRSASTNRAPKSKKQGYLLHEQIGFILRQASQRHATIFSHHIDNLTMAQWAVLSKAAEVGPCSQNQLGRLTGMDVSTIKGVVDRLTLQGLVETSLDPDDGRRLRVSLTRSGLQLVKKLVPAALSVTDKTLSPLDSRERNTLLVLLKRLR